MWPIGFAGLVIVILGPAAALRQSANAPPVPSPLGDEGVQTRSVRERRSLWTWAATHSERGSFSGSSGWWCPTVKPPSPRGRTYNLWKASNSWYSQAGQDKRLEDTIFANMTHPGFFIESGAADGEVNSNTLHYEKKGWSGLLVEPHPSTFKTLMGKNRKAYAFNGALSTTGRPGRMYLDFHDCAGYQGDGECSKLRTTVDFWSLDVEGVESNILQSFPFELIEVGVLLIEMNKNDENNDGIMSVMAKYRFKECGRTVFDRIYVNPRYFRRRWLRTPVEC